jgi:LysR family glycine cleavage system transcriptional activator
MARTVVTIKLNCFIIIPPNVYFLKTSFINYLPVPNINREELTVREAWLNKLPGLTRSRNTNEGVAMKPLNMNAIMYFEAVARHARIGLAANELLVSSSAVSQQIRALEERIGVLLFRRVKRRLVLTEEGERLYMSANEAMKLLRDGQANITRKYQHRNLVIRVPSSFGIIWLTTQIADFVSHFPDINLHVDATPSLTDFERENIDIEIRYGLHQPTGLHNQPLMTDRVLPLCSPRQLSRYRTNDPAKRLKMVRLIHTTKADIKWPAWLALNEITVKQNGHELKFDRSAMSLSAACDNLGVTLETATLALEEIKSGTLVPFAPELGTLDFPAYRLACPARHLNRRAVSSFIEWITTRVKKFEKERDRVLLAAGVAKGQAMTLHLESSQSHDPGSNLHAHRF